MTPVAPPSDEAVAHKLRGSAHKILADEKGALDGCPLFPNFSQGAPILDHTIW